MTSKTSVILKIIEIAILALATAGAFWVGYQQLIINQQLVDEDYKPLLEVINQEDKIKLYNRGSKVINLEFIRLEPTDKPKLFTMHQHSIFPGDYVTLNVIEAVEQYLNQEGHIAPIYEIFFTVKTPSKIKFYQGMIFVRVIYDKGAITDVAIDDGKRKVTVYELDINNFSDLLSS